MLYMAYAHCAPLTIDISISSNVVVAKDCKQTLMKYSIILNNSNQTQIHINQKDLEQQ